MIFHGDKMIEKVQNFNKSDKKLVEMLVNTDDIQIRHVMLPKGEFMPKHISNSNVNLVIVDGKMEITLEDQNPANYEKGSILSIPFNTKMLIKNDVFPTDGRAPIIISLPAFAHPPIFSSIHEIPDS